MNFGFALAFLDVSRDFKCMKMKGLSSFGVCWFFFMVFLGVMWFSKA